MHRKVNQPPLKAPRSLFAGRKHKLHGSCSRRLHADFTPTTMPRAAGDGTIVTTASDSLLAQPESTAGDFLPASACEALEPTAAAGHR